MIPRIGPARKMVFDRVVENAHEQNFNRGRQLTWASWARKVPNTVSVSGLLPGRPG